MKHLRKFFESTDLELEEINDNLAHINDLLGVPHSHKYKMGNGFKYVFTWNLGIKISELQDAKTMINKLKTITENIEDVLAAQSRLGKWEFNMSLSNELRIEMNPVDLGDEEYEFIDGYKWRTLYVFKNEIERFFNANGVRVTRWDLDSSYNEYNETNDLEIYLNKVDIEVANEFKRKFDEELNLKQELIDRQYQVSADGDLVIIMPLEEKASVDTSIKK